MKEIMKMVLVAVMAAAWGHAALPAVRVETRSEPLIATGEGVACVGGLWCEADESADVVEVVVVGNEARARFKRGRGNPDVVFGNR